MASRGCRITARRRVLVLPLGFRATRCTAVKTYKAGDTFYEPSGSVHRVARNPSGKTRTRLLAVILHTRDNKETTVPEKGKE